MSAYDAPTLHNNKVNSQFNVNDFTSNTNVVLTKSTGDTRYLKLTGGTMSGDLVVNGTSYNTGNISVTKNISLNTTTLYTPSSGQLGYTITGTNITNGTTISNNVCTPVSSLSLPVGTWMLFATCTCSGSVAAGTLNSRITSISNSSSSHSVSGYNLLSVSVSTFTSLSTIVQPIIVNNSSTTTYYLNEMINYSTTTMASNSPNTLFKAVRIA